MKLRRLAPDLVEVKGAPNELEAQRYVETQTGYEVVTVTHVALSLYQVLVKAF